MFKRFVLGSLVVVGLSACGQAADGELQDVKISRNADASLTITEGQQSIDVSSVKLPEQNVTLSNNDVTQSLPPADICCKSCSCQDGTCVCTGCTAC